MKNFKKLGLCKECGMVNEDTEILVSEINTWKFLAKGLTQEHQQNVKFQILEKVRNMEQILKEGKGLR